MTVPYFAIQHAQIFPSAVMPLTPLERVVPFFPPAIYAYLSAYLLSALPLLLARDSRNLRLMAFGFAWIACVSNLLFFAWPSVVPAFAAGARVTDPALRMVLAADTNLNACPSLHASLAIYCALCSTRLVNSRLTRAGVWLWALLILASTLLTKQHVALDLLAGGALGWAAYAALFWAQRSEATRSEALEATLEARAALTRGHEADSKH